MNVPSPVYVTPFRALLRYLQVSTRGLRRPDSNSMKEPTVVYPQSYLGFMKWLPKAAGVTVKDKEVIGIGLNGKRFTYGWII